jgi:alpha-N-arabinofuranosidase
MFRGIIPVAFCALLVAAPGHGADAVLLQIKADQVAAHVSPMLCGLMTEEINFSYDGGLYAELVRNRNFKEDPKEPVHWQFVQEQGGTGTMSLDPGQHSTTQFRPA